MAVAPGVVVVGVDNFVLAGALGDIDSVAVGPVGSNWQVYSLAEFRCMVEVVTYPWFLKWRLFCLLLLFCRKCNRKLAITTLYSYWVILLLLLVVRLLSIFFDGR